MELIHSVRISNCNCIKEADIEIHKNVLNIKYGFNGTGKSTISKAIFSKSNDDESGLQSLKPYGIEIDEETKPDVANLKFTRVRVFDESYVNSYLFKENSFLENSFQVFLKSTDCDKLTHEIEDLLSDLQGVFQKSDTIQKLRSFLPKYFDEIKYTDGEISKKGGVGEFLKGNGCGFDKYEELEKYKPFYSNRDMVSVSKWAKWRNDGVKQMNGCDCPFCAGKLQEQEIEKQNKTISKVFKNSALSTANVVLEYIEEAVSFGYIKADSISVLKEYIGNANKADSLLAELKQLAIETTYLITKIEKICTFRPMNVTQEQLMNINNNLDDMIIDQRQLLKFYNTKLILHMIEEIRNKVVSLKVNTGKVKGLFIRYERKIDSLITNRREDINNFFSLAGFPYKFIIKTDGENRAVSYLIPNYLSEENRVTEPEKRLSWGEKNAFSLVMFMFEAISDDADLIVLDDPITSFDKEKNFAVVRRLFDNQKSSLKKRTVIIFTHDLQPIIDYVHGGFFNRFGLTTPVKAKWLQNQNGIISEDDIDYCDLVNTVELTRNIAGDSSYKIPVRIVNLRKYIELTKPNFSETPSYKVLSNLIHGRKNPLDRDEEPLEASLLKVGCKEIEGYLKIGSYDEILLEMSNQKLLDIIKDQNKYNKIIAIRLLFESDRLNLLTKLKKQYPSTCKYVNETNHVENDYIFQLNPLKYFSIPDNYLKDLEEFIISES